MRTEQRFQLFAACGSLTTRRMPAATPLKARWRSIAAAALLAGALALPAAPVDADPGTTELVSVDSAGTQGNADSGFEGLSISADGRFVAFQSNASNLVPGDTNFAGDVFVHDRQTGTTERVSVDSAGTEGNGASGVFGGLPISADGRFVAFQSNASNLVPGDTNFAGDVFVRDRQTGTTERVSVSSAGTQGNTTSFDPSISADGRFVAFASGASNLVRNDKNGSHDVFVHDRETGTTERVSVNSAGTQGNAGSFTARISADGRFVAFASDASNLVPGDTNGTLDVFVHDRQTGTTERVSVDSAGTEGNGASGVFGGLSISADGRFVAFVSGASNLVASDTNENFDVFVHDRQTGTTELVHVDSAGNQGNNAGFAPSLSADGRFVAFDSRSTDLVPRDKNGSSDVFVHDRETGTTRRVSVDSAGTQGNGNSFRPSISADGRSVAFVSIASNLVPGDTNFNFDVFVHDAP